MKKYMSYEDRLDMIVSNAWEKWTLNGLNLDSEDRDMTDIEWLNATVARLEGHG